MTTALSTFETAAGRISGWWRGQLAIPRARAALGLLAFALATSGLFWMDARDRDIQQELAQKRLLVTRAEQLGSTDLWHQRRAETDTARRQVEQKLWDGETDGLAQANFQSWIADQANQAGLRIGDIRSTINTAANNPLKLRQVSIQLSGRFDADAFFKLLQVIAASPRMVVVDQLDIQAGQAPRFEMTLSGFLRSVPKN